VSLYDCLLVVYACLGFFVISGALHVFDQAQHVEFKFLHVLDQAQHPGFRTGCSNVNMSAPSSNGQGPICNAAFAPLDVAEQAADKVAKEW